MVCPHGLRCITRSPVHLVIPSESSIAWVYHSTMPWSWPWKCACQASVVLHEGKWAEGMRKSLPSIRPGLRHVWSLDLLKYKFLASLQPSWICATKGVCFNNLPRWLWCTGSLRTTVWDMRFHLANLKIWVLPKTNPYFIKLPDINSAWEPLINFWILVHRSLNLLIPQKDLSLKPTFL